MDYSLIIVKYGEIGLKGNNKYIFENLLVDNIRAVLKPMVGCKVRKPSKDTGRIQIEFQIGDYEEVLSRVQKVFGIVSLCPAYKVENDIEKIKETALAQVKRLVGENADIKTFKVESRRSDKSFPLKSPEISREVGGFINTSVDEISVDVHHPDIYVNVEVRDKTFIYSESIECFGGMPYRSAGKALLLLSGGIDSPVAGWMMGKRGVEIEGLHFHSYPFTSDRAKEKVTDLAGKLAQYFGRIRVNSVNLLEIQKAINEKCPEEEMTILSRCFMMMIAQRVVNNNKRMMGIVTGESVGQVASQTMEGIMVTNSMATVPVYRPLIAMDKIDIMKIAKTIDTYETSILPFEDCCTVFLPTRVVTKPRLDKIQKSLALLDVEDLIEKALATMETEEITTYGR